MTKKLGGFTAVSNFNLKVHGTERVGFLGPNGAGKTTTMKVFTGLIYATSGTAIVNGIDIGKDKKAALAIPNWFVAGNIVSAFVVIAAIAVVTLGAALYLFKKVVK
jgi:ABC-type multidrug transport system ATPase subunit